MLSVHHREGISPGAVLRRKNFAFQELPRKLK